MGTDYQNTFLESVNDRYQLHKDFAIKQITNKISPHIPTHSDTNTSILYHYTTLEGFKNIIEKGTLWGTNFAYLNDSTELNYGLSIFRKIIDEREYFTSGAHSAEIKSIIEEFQKIWICARYHAYGACFSFLDDSLSQWRGYGQGVAIGFTRQALSNQLFLNTRLEKVVYSNELARYIIESLVDSFVYAIKNYMDDQDYLNIKQILCASFRDWLEGTIPMLKDPAFSDEKEWRIIHFREIMNAPEQYPKVEFRVKNDMLIPYVELRPIFNGKLHIAEIRIGPLDRMQPHLLNSITTFLWKYGYGAVPVKLSDVPFRS
jgi:hypothetical protein